MIKQQLSASSEELSGIAGGACVCAEDIGLLCHDRKGFEREHKQLALSPSWQPEDLGRVPGKASGGCSGKGAQRQPEPVSWEWAQRAGGHGQAASRT